MGQISILVCDECQSLGTHSIDDDVETYHITRLDGRARVDLCNEHSAPLRHLLLNYGEVTPGTTASISRAHFESMISTMEDVELRKKQYLERKKSGKQKKTPSRSKA